jgi:hypothetical protein
VIAGGLAPCGYHGLGVALEGHAYVIGKLKDRVCVVLQEGRGVSDLERSMALEVLHRARRFLSCLTSRQPCIIYSKGEMGECKTRQPRHEVPLALHDPQLMRVANTEYRRHTVRCLAARHVRRPCP